MAINRLLIIAALSVAILCIVGIAATPAQAQGLDDLQERRGVSGSLAQPDPSKQGKGPSKLQVAVGVGSIFVMIAVVKWL
jgi:hypothetical protein